MTWTALLLTVLLPFAEGQPTLHTTAVPPYALANTVIRLHFDIPRGTVYGEELATVRTRAALDVLPFDSLGIHYRSIAIDGRPAAYSVDDARERVSVRLSHRVPAGTRLLVAFRYWTQPQRGVYFVRPDRAYPNETPEIWTQGETTDNRRWFPTWDEPNNKTPSELILTVPSGWTAIGNGFLKAHTLRNQTETWDWKSPNLKSTYLIAFAAGRFSELRGKLGSLAVDSYVSKADAPLNRICFGDTPRMIEYYQRVIGFPYPFSKYDQIAVERFTFGGMENASATILTDGALHPAVEDVERNCDNLVSHELAQQWFGDDVTMADWSNEWINEGFATYFDELWTGRQGGESAFEYARFQGERAYFEETQQYLRPIVEYRYNDPLDLFDVSGHERAAAVLHMLRYLVGDKRFFAALHIYLRQYQYKNADTNAFFESIDRTLGENLGWFKDEWFYRASYLHYTVRDAYDAARKTLIMSVEQHNADGKPFRMPVEIDVFSNGSVTRVRPWISRNRQVVRIAHIAAAPQMVLFDPNENLLCEVTFPKSVAVLAYQLTHAPHVGDREWALSQLAARSAARGEQRTRAMQSIARAAGSDPFYGVRADAVADAAAFGDSATVLAAMHDSDVRVMLAAVEAAPRARVSQSVVGALQSMTADPNPDVSGSALTALGELHAPNAYGLLVAAAGRASFHDVIAAHALAGLAALGDPRAMPLLLSKTAYGVPERERDGAVVALAMLAAKVHASRRVLPTLLQLVSGDALISTRLAAADALGELGDPSAVSTLRRVERRDSQEIVRLAAWQAIQHCRAGTNGLRR